MESELKFVHVRKNTEFYRIWYCKFQFLLSKTCDLAKTVKIIDTGTAITRWRLLSSKTSRVLL